VIIHESAAQVAERIPLGVGVIAAIDEQTCSLQTGSDSAEMLAAWLGMIGADFEVTDSPELVEQLRLLAERYLRAASPPSTPGKSLPGKSSAGKLRSRNKADSAES